MLFQGEVRGTSVLSLTCNRSLHIYSSKGASSDLEQFRVFRAAFVLISSVDVSPVPWVPILWEAHWKKKVLWNKFVSKQVCEVQGNLFALDIVISWGKL